MKFHREEISFGSRGRWNGVVMYFWTYGERNFELWNSLIF